LLPNHLIIATGSSPNMIPGIVPDGKRVLTSDQALDMTQLPKSMLIIGGGVIGVEWASMLADFGVEVTLAEALPRLIEQEEEMISKALSEQLTSKGVRILTDTAVDAASLQVGEQGIAIQAESNGE